MYEKTAGSECQLQGTVRDAIAPTKAKLLWTGIELKVFNHLSEPKTAKDVVEKIRTHSVNTELLEGLAACNLLEKKNGLSQNTPVTQKFLVVEESPNHPTRNALAQYQESGQLIFLRG